MEASPITAVEVSAPPASASGFQSPHLPSRLVMILAASLMSFLTTRRSAVSPATVRILKIAHDSGRITVQILKVAHAGREMIERILHAGLWGANQTRNEIGELAILKLPAGEISVNNWSKFAITKPGVVQVEANVLDLDVPLESDPTSTEPSPIWSGVSDCRA